MIDQIIHCQIIEMEDELESANKQVKLDKTWQSFTLKWHFHCQTLMVTLHKHKPDGFMSEVFHSEPGAAFGSYNKVRYSGSFFNEKSNSFPSTMPNRNPMLELPVNGTGTIFHELSSGLNIDSFRWFFHSIQKSFLPTTAWAVTITQPFFISFQLCLLGLYTSTNLEFPMVKLDLPPMTYSLPSNPHAKQPDRGRRRLSIRVHLSVSGSYTSALDRLSPSIP